MLCVHLLYMVLASSAYKPTCHLKSYSGFVTLLLFVTLILFISLNIVCFVNIVCYVSIALLYFYCEADDMTCVVVFIDLHLLIPPHHHMHCFTPPPPFCPAILIYSFYWRESA